MVFLGLGVAGGGLMGLIGHYMWRHMNPPKMTESAVTKTSSATMLTCTGPLAVTGWTTVPSRSPEGAEATKQAILSVNAQRHKTCVPKVKDLQSDERQFLHGVNHTHVVGIQHKCLTSQKAAEYKFHFQAQNSTFSVTLHRSLAGIFTFMASVPPACNITWNATAGQSTLDVNSPSTVKIAKFGVAETFWQCKTKNCLLGNTKINYKKVVSGTSQVVDGILYKLVVEVGLVGAASAETLRNIEVDVYRRSDGLVDTLRAPNKDPCQILTAPPRRLDEDYSKGAIDEDWSEIFDRRLRHAERNLTGGRAPLEPRHIKIGTVPNDHDPRAHNCFQKIKVYDQGSCGSCYANAFAQMMGLRKCLHDQGANPAPVRLLGACLDDQSWTTQTGLKCSRFGKGKDVGCNFFQDYGQKTHCRVTCGTCPPANAGGATSSNPWYGAQYSMMPAVADLAPCSKGTTACDGGNTADLWNDNLMNLHRDISVMGQTCLPYDMKCIQSSGIVNPLSAGLCSQFQGYEVWHKPCSCIPKSMRPIPTTLTCPASVKPGCGFPVPVAAFTVKTMVHGLPVWEAVLNLQRHIQESGPLFIGFTTTSKFMSWPWAKKPIYTGGGTPSGGHAVTLVGWGSGFQDGVGVDYWLIRNSWGASFADGGYFKFKRGVNLDDIESRSAAASFSYSNFHDWSPPSCSMTSSSFSWQYTTIRGKSRLYKFLGDIDFTCTKPAVVSLFVSSKLVSHKDIYGEVFGTQPLTEKSYPQGKSTVKGINLIKLGFGASEGDVWVQFNAKDSHGNEHENSQFLTIPNPSR